MFIRSALTLALVALFAAPLSAQGQPRGGGRGMKHHGPQGGPMMMQCLDLTDAQKTSLKAIADKHREATKAKHEATMAAREAYRVAMRDPATSTDQLKALHDKVSQAQFELALDRRAMMQESMTILTPEQKAKAEQLRAERGGKRAGGRGQGRGQGRGECPMPAQK